MAILLASLLLIVISSHAYNILGLDCCLVILMTTLLIATLAPAILFLMGLA
ncbi:hypothetical protein EDC56_3005 [Sinobacterium caligoides]|uniref:Uncharacterized protein n=1 Tax=Sinobacterium caligoides TaxID=933926 RepID=A0A3N2DKM9_9GAMM|nr:hypothetical protein [Sinobacterium caligoides]ROS00354.1 hypothetical protein EDC56_3005 [Sinobacterium caligoides]